MKLIDWYTEKLVRRLIGPSLLLGILAVLMLSMVTYFSIRNLLEKTVSEQLRVSVDLQEKELNRWMEDQKKTVLFISRAPFIRERVIEILSRDKIERSYQDAYRELSEYLFSYVKYYPGLLEVMLLSNRGGQVLFSTSTEHIGDFRSQDTFFIKGREGLFIQGVYPWRENAEPAVTISRPLLGDKGDKSAVLAVHLNLERMDEIVGESPGLGQTGEIYLVDKFNSFINSDRFGREDFPRGVHTEGINRAIAGEEGALQYTNYIGEPVVGYYRWLPGLEVALLAEIHQSEAFSPARQIGLVIGSLGIGLIVCLVVGNLFFARKISQPLGEMSEMSRRIADGDFSVSVPVSGEDETSLLAASLNRMSSHLQVVYNELGDTAEYFRTIFNLSPSAIGVQRFDNGAFVHVNEGFCQMFDVSVEQASGRTAVDLRLWQRDTSRLRLAAKLKDEGHVVEYESKFVRGDGTVIDGVISCRVVELGNEKFIVSILSDITPMRDAERELRKTTEHLQLIMDRMPVGCIVWNPLFQVDNWNPEAEKIFGYSESEATGQHAYSLIVPANIQPQIDAVWDGLLEGDESAHSVNENVTRDGRIIVCSWYNMPLKDEDGTPRGVISMVTDVTEQQRAEENLKHQKELLQTILDAIPAPIFFKDAEGVYRGCNVAFCEYIGQPYEKIVGHTVYDIAPPEKAQVYEEADAKLLGQGGVQIYEAKVRYADGSDRDVIFHKAVYNNQDGAVGGLVGNMLDVTDIRQAESELAKSELSYREIFNASSEAILIRDFNTGEIVDVNQSMLDMYGYSHEEAMLTTIADLSSGVPPYTVEKAYENLSRAKAGEFRLFEWQAKRKDGSLFWVEISLQKSIIQGADRILAVIRNIDGRKEAERAQRESDERFHLLIEHAADALFLHDSEGCVLTVNQRACDWLGYSHDELLGMNIADFEKGVTEIQLREFWDSLETGKATLIEGNHTRKDGTTFPVDVNVVKFAFQGADFFLALARDVSERRATEEELARYRTGLEELVRERTRQLELAQEELVQKERLAVLGQLTATVSHELRNPLGTVKNSIYLLARMLEKEQNEKVGETLDLADRNVRRCDGIINELLDFTRQQELVKVEVDFCSWLRSILDEQSFPEDVKVTCNCRMKLAVPLEPERMRRAIVNILTNAVQAVQEVGSRKGLVKIRVGVSGERFEAVISDNGAGIENGTMERIFEPMFSTKTFGVGLGMPIVKNIMEEHGGGIELESVPSRGTSVTLWLPLK